MGVSRLPCFYGPIDTCACRGTRPFSHVERGLGTRLVLRAALLNVPTMNISRKFKLHANCRVFCKWSYTKLKSIKDNNIWHLQSSIKPPNNKSKPFLGLAIKLEVEEYSLTCLSIHFQNVCTRNERGDWSNKKMALHVDMSKKLTCKGNIYALTCFWFDYYAKNPQCS